MKKLELSLLPNYDKWKNTDPDSSDLMLKVHTKIIGFAAVLSIINPEVYLFNGMYFLNSDKIGVYDYIINMQGNLKENDIEKRVNSIRIADLFFHDENADEVNVELLDYFAFEIKKYWSLNLANDFPDLSFIIEIVKQKVDPEITFYVDRDRI